MTRLELLGAWVETRRSAAAWAASLSGNEDERAAVRACAAALARPQEPSGVAQELLKSEEFELAELLLLDDRFRNLSNATEIAALELTVERARAAVAEHVRGLLSGVSDRARRHGVSVDEKSVLAIAASRGRAAKSRVEEVERDVAAADRKRAGALADRLYGLKAPAGMAESVFQEWQGGITQAIALGALDAAEAAIEAGPSADRPPPIEMPLPVVWPYRAEAVERVVEWFFGEGVIPPGFEQHLPSKTDKEAWAFLAALRSVDGGGPEQPRPMAVLRALAGILDCRVVRSAEDETAAFVHVDDLSASGFHAFGRRRWPEGIPMWIAERPDADGPFPSDGLAIRVSRGPVPTRARTLCLDLHDVLAVIRDNAHRRQRLLAQLGRQLPLEYAFDLFMADESSRWERKDVPSDLTAPDQPIALVAAPGMGKSTLLLELARLKSGVVVPAATEEDLPGAEWVLVDGGDRMAPDTVRRVVKEIHWARTTRVPPPSVVFAVRPEAVADLERVSPNMFKTVKLAPRSHESLREQARIMLGWVGVEADAAGSYDRLAFLASGNPTILCLLCRSLALVLSRAGSASRTVHPADVEAAWNDAVFRQSVHDLIWAPLQALEGVQEVLRALVEFGDPGAPLSIDLLAWGVEVSAAKREPSWIRDRVELLHAYGVARLSADGIQLGLGGIGALAREWAIA